MEALKKSHEQGELSTETYHRFIGVDPTIERARIRKEVAREDRPINDEAVPTRFKQDVVKDTEEGKEKTTKTTSENVGRAKGENDKTPRKPRKDK